MCAESLIYLRKDVVEQEVEKNEKKKGRGFRYVWGVFMVIAYLGIAYLILFTPVLIRYNHTTNSVENDQNRAIRIVLGVVLAIYALFRGYRIWKITK